MLTIKWRVVADELPETKPLYADGPLTSSRVLIFNGHYVTLGKYEQTFTKRIFRWVDARGYVAMVTHWMPLPEPPEKP